jgi:hypothetical protein
MTRKPLKSADGEGFLRAFTDEWADIRADHDVELVMTISPTYRKGVLKLTIKAWAGGLVDIGFPKAQYSVEYPTAAVASFEAALYQAMVRLQRVIEQQERYPMGKA